MAACLSVVETCIFAASPLVYDTDVRWPTLACLLLLLRLDWLLVCVYKVQALLLHLSVSAWWPTCSRIMRLAPPVYS